MKNIVMKFGGTSVATGKNVRHVANLIANHAGQDCRVVTVVSALDGVTDQLIKAAEEAKKGKRKYISDFKQEILEKHLSVANEAIEDKRLKEETERVLRERVDELERELKKLELNVGDKYIRKSFESLEDTNSEIISRLNANENMVREMDMKLIELDEGHISSSDLKEFRREIDKANSEIISRINSNHNSVRKMDAKMLELEIK